jgi:hypothetical protein
MAVFAESLRTGLNRACGFAGLDHADGAGASIRSPYHHKWGAGQSGVFKFADSL